MVHREKISVIAFFSLYLVIGLWIVQDYGLAYDEPSIRHVGLINVRYIFEGDQQLFQEPDRYYGPFFEICLVLIEKLFQLQDSRQIYVMRHVVTFLVFYLSSVCFYRLCRYRFRNWKLALCGPILLLSSPLIFGHAFFNSKDLAFLAIFIISMTTCVAYLEKRSWPRLYLHGFVSAILIDVRILGGIVPGLTALAIFCFPLVTKATIRRRLLEFCQYSLLVVIFARLFFPISWERPIYHFTQAFLEMKRYPWNLDVLYLGQFIKATELPWHYIPVWFSVTTPLLHQGGFVIGLIVACRIWFKTPVRMMFKSPQRYDLLFAIWFFLPVVTVIFLHSVMYDGWRHLFFIYPAFVLFAVNGIAWLWKFATRRSWLKVVLAGGFILGLADPIYFMVKYHPYEHLYFNRLAGANMQTVRQRFEVDYWGLAYTEALEYIAQHDPDPVIPVVVDRFPRNYCNAMLPQSQRERIICVDNLAAAKYFIANYRMNPNGYPCSEEFYAVTVRGANIAVVHPTRSCKTE